MNMYPLSSEWEYNGEDIVKEYVQEIEEQWSMPLPTITPTETGCPVLISTLMTGDW